MPDKDAIVRTVGLTKVFRDFWLREKVTAVKDLDLTIHHGEVYGLLGPNGSGKSTTLKMVLGLMFPSKGRVLVMGKSPTDVAAKAKIGFLPEESYLYPFLDARETLDYYGRLFHQPRAERQRRIDMLLDMVGLAGAAYRRVGEYSKGMQRRIGMAQALINDPELLILDEPTSGMDPLAARQFKDLISELSRRGKTIILSSHLLSDMEDVCARVGILYAGQLRSEGTLDDLLARRNLSQITTERLDGQTLRELQELIARRHKAFVGIESPRDKLETLFLRVIQDAQGLRGRGAAAEAGAVAEFLRSDSAASEGTQLIERLVADERSAPTKLAEKIEEVSAPRPPAQDALKDLLEEKAEPKPAAPSHRPAAKTPDKPLPQEQADKSMIDSLIDESGKDANA